MNVFIIEPAMTTNETDEMKSFIAVVKEQVERYITITLVGQNNINRCKSQIQQDSLVVVFNDRNKEILDTSSVYKFLKKAKEENALIWPVAMDKDSSIPLGIISDKQSYDVSEQLRCRNLNRDYLESVAKAFSRKIISRVIPTIYDETGMIFVSHRRLDGEDITAKLCDQIIVQCKETNTFRDVTAVQVGDEAQEEIDSAMSKSDAFIFIHTEKSSESGWIQKELRYAILRNIPVLWVQINNACISNLKIRPTENPHLHYSASEFEDDNRIMEIVDEILHKAFEIIMARNNKVFDFVESIHALFGERLHLESETNMLYTVSASRKGYCYPQRSIRQYIQVFGKTPTENDREKLKTLVTEDKTKYDSIAILTDRIVKSQIDGIQVKESFEDYYYNWHTFFKGQQRDNGMEIIISGAFPDGDEICKQSLTDALVIFAKTIMKRGYTLTFGSHPTFQELFFEIAREVCQDDSSKKIKMYISKWFEDKYKTSKAHYLSNAELIEIEKETTCPESLKIMRKEMIQRKTVSAMVCLGGKIKGNKQEEGIREEIQMAQEVGIPVFVVGTVGGCSSVVASEFKNSGWEQLNAAPNELNDMFMESLDYFDISQKLLDFL